MIPSLLSSTAESTIISISIPQGRSYWRGSFQDSFRWNHLWENAGHHVTAAPPNLHQSSHPLPSVPDKPRGHTITKRRSSIQIRRIQSFARGMVLCDGFAKSSLLILHKTNQSFYSKFSTATIRLLLALVIWSRPNWLPFIKVPWNVMFVEIYHAKEGRISERGSWAIQTMKVTVLVVHTGKSLGGLVRSRSMTMTDNTEALVWVS
jgi:hypothetical protein